MLTPAAFDDVRTALQAALDGSDVDDRAQLLELTNRMIMDHVKFRVPGGEGFDGAVGPERRGLNPMLNALLEYVDEQCAHKSDSPESQGSSQ